MNLIFYLTVFIAIKVIFAQNCCRFRATTEPITTTSTESSLLNETKFKELHEECGKRSQQQFASSLVLGGHKVTRGDFPWLAVLYHATKRFMCGGSLVSRRLVVTAAHCVYNKREIEPIREYDATFYMGKHKLGDLFEKHYVNSGVDKFVLYPDWNPKEVRYNSDISIAVLSKSIEFSKLVKPICLWHKNGDRIDLNRGPGLIAGWGITHYGRISDVPRFISVPAIDDLECLRSNRKFNDVLSYSSFCVGDRSGNTPCNGDSGGGYVLRFGDRYYLRGLVSLALLNEDLQCSDVDYSLITDATLYTDWIYKYISMYD